MGIFYTRNFNIQIEENLTEKIQLPAVLMSLRALNFNAVTNLEAISDLIQEEVLDAYVIKADGTIFYTPDSQKEGKNYRSFLNQQEKTLPHLTMTKAEFIHFDDAQGNFFISTLAPLIVENRFLGNLYVKISANRAEQKKQDILFLFLGGSALTILLTTVLEAFSSIDYLCPVLVGQQRCSTKWNRGISQPMLLPQEILINWVG